jgi:hypothetical protein
MARSNVDGSRTSCAQRSFSFRFTPAEWRALLADPDFLKDRDNSYSAPRRLMGIAVVIVPDHR